MRPSWLKSPATVATAPSAVDANASVKVGFVPSRVPVFWNTRNVSPEASRTPRAVAVADPGWTGTGRDAFAGNEDTGVADTRNLPPLLPIMRSWPPGPAADRST